MGVKAGESVPIQQPETAFDPDILIYPTVVNGIIHDIYSLYAEDAEGEYWLTPPVEQVFALDEPESTAMVALGGRKDDKLGHVTLFVVNGEDSSLVPYVTAAWHSLLVDGKGETIDDPAQYRVIRELMDSLKQAHHERVLQIAEAFDRNAFMEERLFAEIERLRARATELESLQVPPTKTDEVLQPVPVETAVKTPPTNIKIYLKSAWADEGEESLLEEYSEADFSLTGAIDHAIATFKEKNGRSDVQASTVTLEVVRGSAIYKIPENIWRPYYREARSSDHTSEKSAIGYRQKELEKN